MIVEIAWKWTILPGTRSFFDYITSRCTIFRQNRIYNCVILWVFVDIYPIHGAYGIEIVVLSSLKRLILWVNIQIQTLYIYMHTLEAMPQMIFRKQSAKEGKEKTGFRIHLVDRDSERYPPLCHRTWRYKIHHLQTDDYGIKPPFIGDFHGFPIYSI